MQQPGCITRRQVELLLAQCHLCQGRALHPRRRRPLCQGFGRRGRAQVAVARARHHPALRRATPTLRGVRLREHDMQTLQEQLARGTVGRLHVVRRRRGVDGKAAGRQGGRQTQREKRVGLHAGKDVDNIGQFDLHQCLAFAPIQLPTLELHNARQGASHSVARKIVTAGIRRHEIIDFLLMQSVQFVELLELFTTSDKNQQSR
jgi:hypothetical protein